MKSIQTKIVALIMMVVMLCSVVIGGIGIWHLKTISEQNSAQIMNLGCREEGKRIEHIFHSVEQSVKIVAHNTLQTQRMETVLGDSTLRVMYIEKLRPILLAAANSTEGAVAAYIHFNPEIAPSDSGLFYSKTDFSDAFLVQPVTDLDDIPEDMSVLDWYYKAVEAGEAVWLEPYNNGKMSEDVISYVVPIYQGELLVGIAGMDILFSDITQSISNIKIYENGAACLINGNGEVLFHPEEKPEYQIRNIGEWQEFVKNTENDAEGKYAFEYYSDAKRHRLTYYEMENQMGLILTAPISEIDKENNAMIRIVIISVAIISVICILVSYIMGQSIVRPLKELTEAAKKIAAGNMKITLPSGSQDEVGVLSDSLQQMVDCLSVYMDRISELAYTDPLTGVKSKTAYKEEVHKIEQGIQDGMIQFGLVIFDLNDLKLMNDTYGHEAGDLYIKNACRLICTTYKHSPVFRIGGDEFAAILRGQDLLEAEKLMHRFYDRMSIINRDAMQPSDKVSVAAGMAVFKEERDYDFQRVFKRADENMYKNKSSMKSGAGPILEVEKFEG